MRVGVVERCSLVRGALCSLVGSNRSCQVVLDADSLSDCLESLRNVKVDLLLIDADALNGLALVSQVGKLFPGIKLLLLVDDSDEEFQLRALEAGAWGCVSKTSPPAVLQSALEVLGRGELWMSRKLAQAMIRKLTGPHESPGPRSGELTAKEWEILALLATGCCNKEIASRGSISQNTVKTHLGSIYRKLRVTTRLEAALRYSSMTGRDGRQERNKAAARGAIAS